MISHNYLSTACVHGIHGRCRFTCKFCHEACVCECHRDAANTAATMVAEAFRRVGQGDIGTTTVNEADAEWVERGPRRGEWVEARTPHRGEQAWGKP